MNRNPRFITGGNAFTSASPVGEAHNLHSDLTVWITNATRKEYLWFANHLPEIIDGFEGVENAAINALRAAFDQLTALAE